MNKDVDRFLEIMRKHFPNLPQNDKNRDIFPVHVELMFIAVSNLPDDERDAYDKAMDDYYMSDSEEMSEELSQKNEALATAAMIASAEYCRLVK